MIIIKQRKIDYRWKEFKCNTHNRENIAEKEGQVIGKICKKCGAELLAPDSRKVIGVFTKHFGGGIVVQGSIKIKVGK